MNLLYTSRLRPSFLAFVRRIRIALFASRPPMVERRTPSSESLSDSASHVGSVNSSGITITIHGDEESRPSAQGNASFTTVNTGFNSQTDIHEHSTTILSLSREDLVSIFLEVSRPSRRTGCRLSPGAVLSLGAVCREWRRALLHTAEVWGQLLDIDRNSLECFQTFIERSDDSPIYLFSRQILETTSEERLAVWEVALAHLSRCVEFQIEYPSDVGDRVDLRPILDIFYRPYQPLHFTVSASSTRNTLISIVSSSNHDTGRDVHFQVADWVMPWNLSAPCFHSTTELVVELENSRPLESMELWISVLHNLPNLRGLTLVDCIHIPPYIRSDTLKTCEDCNGSVTLLHLEHLKLCGNFQIFALLFQHLDVPMACSFHFDLQVQTNPIILHDIHHSTDETDRVEPLFHVFAIFLRTPRESGFDQWILNVGKSLLSIEAKSVSATEYSIFKFAIDNDFAVGLQARIISQCLLHLANPDSGFEPVTQVALSLHDDNVPSEVVKGLHAHLSQMQYVERLYLNALAMEKLVFTVLQQRPVIYDPETKEITIDHSVNSLFPEMSTLILDSSAASWYPAWASLGSYLTWRYDGDRGEIEELYFFNAPSPSDYDSDIVTRDPLLLALEDLPGMFRGLLDVGEMRWKRLCRFDSINSVFTYVD